MMLVLLVYRVRLWCCLLNDSCGDEDKVVVVFCWVICAAVTADHINFSCLTLASSASFS